MKPSVHCQQKFWNRLKAKGFGGTSLSVVGKCMIKILWGEGVVMAFKTPSPNEQLLPLLTPCFKMFFERSINVPHTPTSSIFHCNPLPIHHPSPLKNFNCTLKYHPPPHPFRVQYLWIRCSMMTTAGLVNFRRNPLMSVDNLKVARW